MFLPVHWTIKDLFWSITGVICRGYFRQLYAREQPICSSLWGYFEKRVSKLHRTPWPHQYRITEVGRFNIKKWYIQVRPGSQGHSYFIPISLLMTPSNKRSFHCVQRSSGGKGCGLAGDDNWAKKHEIQHSSTLYVHLIAMDPLKAQNEIGPGQCCFCYI